MSYDSKFEALSSSTRRAVFEHLRAGPQSVGDLAEKLPVSRPAVSQHLKILKDAGLVTQRPDGVRRVYSVNDEGVAQMRDYFDRFWETALDAYARSLNAKDA